MTDHEQADLVHHLPDAVIVAGRDGLITIWNAAAERIFGFNSSEALGQSLDLIIPENFRERHWTAFDRSMESGTTKYVGHSLPTRALTKDGREIYVELGFAILHDASGTASGAVATARDITERFERDRELRRELRALKEAQATA